MLRPETEKVWSCLRSQPLLAGFILVGGSALALHLRHRFSEDLDFMYPAERLPRSPLDALIRVVEQLGVEFRRHDDPGAMAEFNNGGLDLLDYQQDFLANKTVKVSFFAPEAGDRSVLTSSAQSSEPRLATLDELFRTKSLLSARRSRTRDWFDIYVLMTRCGYTMKDYFDTFSQAGQADQATIGLQRLCSGKPASGDESFEAIQPSPPNVQQLARFFQNQRDIFERTEANHRRPQANGAEPR